MAIYHKYQEFIPKQLHLPIYILQLILASCTALFLATLAVSILIYVQFNVHEFGHFSACVFGSVVKGTHNACAYTNWVDVPIFGNYIVLKAPQQTTSDGPSTLLTVVGGPGLSMLLFLFLGVAYWLLAKEKRKEYWIIPACFILFEFGNIVCGTDNASGLPFNFCSLFPAQVAMGYLPVIAIFTAAWLLYPVAYEAFTEFLTRYILELRKVSNRKK